MRLIALDPGGTTGVCAADLRHYNHSWALLHTQIGPELHHKHLWDELTFYDPKKVITEDFEYRQQQRTNVVMVSLEYIGIAALWCELRGRELVRQKAAIGKAFWTDEKLKGVGLYLPGKPHANDATRHMLYYISFTLKDNYWVNKLAPT